MKNYTINVKTTNSFPFLALMGEKEKETKAADMRFWSETAKAAAERWSVEGGLWLVDVIVESLHPTNSTEWWKLQGMIINTLNESFPLEY